MQENSFSPPCTLSLPELFRLQGGGELASVELKYESYGVLNEKKDNAILICHALTMNSHVTNNGAEGVEQGWWNFMVGPDCVVDTKKFFVICTDVLGGCTGSTGPQSKRPDGEGIYGTHFPVVTVEDMVELQRVLLDYLGIKKLYAVIGGSLGGMQALDWSVRYPERVERVVAIATGANLSPQGLAFDLVGRQCVINDPDWKNGCYSPESRLQGLAVARMIGHVTYISKKVMDEKFGRKLQKDMTESQFGTSFEVESFLRYQGDKFIKRFDANSYLYLTKAMDMYDLGRGYSSLKDSLSRAKSRFLLIAFSSDWLFPPENAQDIAVSLSQLGIAASFVTVDTESGHDAFLLDTPSVQPMLELVENFLRS